MAHAVVQVARTRRAVRPTLPDAGKPDAGVDEPQTPEAAAQKGEVPLHAVRTSTPPQIDGDVNDAVWATAPVFKDFVQVLPVAGAAPTEQSELRVLYDDTALYVSVICHDSAPDTIDRPLATRDDIPQADRLELSIDSAFERRNGYFFTVTAGGVLGDALLYSDVNSTTTWDAVWSGAAAMRPDGWSAEWAIPLSTFRFSASKEQTWGLHVRRYVYRLHEISDSKLIPITDNAWVSKLGVLEGLVDLKPVRQIEVVPYVVGRASLRPQFSDPTTPKPRLFEPSGDIGVDLRTTLLSDLTLTATVNPDFGQVEADQVILNLTNLELFFPEKRPFFNQGLELFEPVGDEYVAPHRLFYSRRIGLDAPILGAAKLIGALGGGVQVGVLDAVVLGAADPGKAAIAFTTPTPSQLAAVEAMPDQSVMFHLTRPLHLGKDSELPATPPTATNFNATTVRADFTDTFALGAMFAAATPLAPRCAPADFATPAQYDLAECRGQGGEVASVDWNARSAGRDWVFLGALEGSRREDGLAADIQPDGVAIHPGDLGYGGYFKAGKFGGEGMRVGLSGDYASPRLDLNSTGYLATQNLARAGANVGYVRTQDLGALRNMSLNLSADSSYTTDTRWTPRGNNFALDFLISLPSYDSLGVGAAYSMPRDDVREIAGTGIPFERRQSASAYVLATSDVGRPVSLQLKATGVYALPGLVAAELGWGVQGTLVLRPFSRFQTRIDAQWANTPNGARWVDTLPDLDAADPTRQHFLFGQQESQNLSITLRQTVVLRPTLTVTAYAQLFSAYVHYPRYFTGSAAPGGTIEQAALTPATAAASADFHEAALNINVVARWEYRIGSTLFLVYTHAGNELGLSPTQAPAQSLFPLRLGPGPATDTVLLKWSWWFGR